MERQNDSLVQDETFGSVACQYRYNNSDHIAKGAFGIVYQAAITNRGDFSGAEQVAVKVVHLDRQSELMTDGKKWSKLLQRLQNLPELSHDHLVAYHKITIAKGLRGGASIELLMDYHAGEDLRTVIRNLRQQGALLRETEAVSYTIQIAEGLQFLHDKQLIHGDLKPCNILTTYSENGDRKLAICDLDDIVQMERDATCSHDITNLRGTYRFMSPEMLRKFVAMQESENPGRKTDMWSLGCIMLELADCVVGNDQKWLRKEHAQIQVGNKVNDERFIHLIIDGYVPCAIEAIPSCLRASLQTCSHTASSERISARLLIQQLKAREFIMIFRHIHRANECYLFDPLTKSATVLTLPVDLYIHLNVLAVSKGSVVCQSTVEGSLEVVVWNVQEQTSPTIPSPGSCKPQYLLIPIAVMDKIYFFSGDGKFRMLDLRDGMDVALKLPTDGRPIWGTRYGVRDGNRIIYIGQNWAEAHPLPMWVKCYDTVTNEWNSLPELPWRYGFAMVVLQKTVYVLGGDTDDDNRRSCMRLDLQSPTRQRETICDLLEGREHHCAFISDSMIYVFGGYRGKVAVSCVMEVYDTQRDLWSAVFVTGIRERFSDNERCQSVAANVTLNWPVPAMPK